MPKNHRKGFTLLELTLVLVFTGIVIGSLWFTVDSLMFSQRIDQLEKGVITTSQRMRNFYRDRQIKNDTGALSNTAALQLNIVAPQINTNGQGSGIGHNLNYAPNGLGAITISYDAAGCGQLNSFAMTMANLTKDACNQMAPRLGGTRQKLNENGIIAVKINNINVVTVGKTNNITTYDFNSTLAESSCADGSALEICFGQ